ncbi:hypothetical protein JF66_15120 [Cryobacterium sp. MLB-32]|uniref:PspC domain-containing protein n=1 Tax=Cryobacterium sp. MLB-32 TaxID=1529318 RepID=UPI0004E62601|nr:PspC domain-containing protein [Cryobacterium sp. MLB-32]KFF58914.1 hypothetical protein JF66_15120 [Cryobacterium sp. MLB-32]
MTDAPNSAPAPPADRVTRFFDAIRSAGIVRDQDRWIAGVCGGLAARAGLPPFVVRLIAVILVLLSAPAVFAYAVGWALLPDSDGRIHAEEAIRGRFEPVMILIGILLLTTFVPFSPAYWWNAGSSAPGLPSWLATTFTVVWSVLIIGGIVALVVYLAQKPPPAVTATPAMTAAPRESTDAATPSPSGTWQGTVDQNAARQEQNRIRQEQYRARQAERSAARRARRPGAGFTAIVLGIALMCGAVAALIFTAGVWSPAALALGLSVALGVIALGMIAAGFRGRESGALSGYAFLAVLALLITGVAPTGVQFVLIGSPTWSVSAPTAVDQTSSYALLVGQATLDLSALDDGPMTFMRSTASQSIDVWAAVGQTRVILPAYAPVLIDTSAFVGAVTYTGPQAGQDQQGIFLQDARLFNSNNRRVPTVVHIRSFVGQVTIISPPSTGENTP